MSIYLPILNHSELTLNSLCFCDPSLTKLLAVQMAKLSLPGSKPLKTIICLFLLALSLHYASSARLLDEDSPQTPFPAGAPVESDPSVVDDPDVAPVVPPDTSLPSGQVPANPVAQSPPSTPLPTGPGSVVPPGGPVSPVTNVAPGATPAVGATGSVVPPGGPVPPVTNVAPGAIPAVGATGSVVPPGGPVPPVTNVAPGTTAAVAAPGNPDHATLSFFMHDILGGSHPSGRVVTGVIANSDANGLPFSKPNNQFFPLNGGVPLNTVNGVINNNNYPFLVGLNGNTIVSNSNGGNNVNAGNSQAFVTAGQLPAGLTLQQLMFGSITVVDNQITEGHELGSAVLGSAQGFYVASSLDGSSHTLALTALFHGGDHGVDDTISFFGVHRTATPISHLAVIGGTGKYEEAKGYATIETDLHHEDQHTTDGVETITQFTVYLTP